ncbi:MAG: aspartate--tRNA(Asn) ligase [Thermoprotei archaeon]|nr:MAG: aspartate--tRNA(Asn) ligase [Thermoprotei archaeon]
MKTTYKTHFARDIKAELNGYTVTLAGWVHIKRDLGGKKFLILRDKTGTVQLILTKGKTPQHIIEMFNKLTRESVIEVKGVVKASAKAPRGVEVEPLEIKVLSLARTPLPVDVTGKVHADIDTRLNNRVLDLRRKENQAIFRIQDTTLKAIREKLRELGFIEVLTPKIIASATEGGAQLFPVLYFGREAFLAQSPQLYKELLASAFERVFEIGPAFRAEESDTPYHLSEFISVDIEAAFMNYLDVMNVLEEVTDHVLTKIRKENLEDLKTLKYEEYFPKMRRPIKKITYDEAVNILQEHKYPIEKGEDLSTPALRKLGEILDEAFYFVIDWPTSTRPFYTMPKRDNEERTESFDFVYKWLEIASGSTRIHERSLLEKQLIRQGLDPKNFEYFLKWFNWGMPPHAGWGLGLSRLMLILTGAKNVREVVLFPRDKKRLVP